MGEFPNPFGTTVLQLLSGILRTIMFWSRAQGKIPGGWQIADGTNGTPDLRGSFSICFGGPYPVGSTGGSASHDHTGDGTIGRPHLDSGNQIASGTDYHDNLEDNYVELSVDNASSLPPYKASFPIIFVGS